MNTYLSHSAQEDSSTLPGHYSPGNLVLMARSELNGFSGKDS
jgi:hypothetical protein